MTDTLFDNVITLSFDNRNHDTIVEIVHNDLKLYQGELPHIKTFEIKECKENNTLVIKNVVYGQVLDVCMFGLGENKLKHLLKYENNRVILHYSYPVFPWLHRKLNFGWIVKSI